MNDVAFLKRQVDHIKALIELKKAQPAAFKDSLEQLTEMLQSVEENLAIALR